ncbi:MULTISPECIES: ATP-binding protein [Streptomycetaceae]|nr:MULTISPECIES: ATP-binding protein [Streptomycetaceae]
MSPATGFSQTLPCEAASARRARILVGAALSAWGMGGLADVGEVVVSELVGNAVTHARSRRLRVTATRLGDQRERVTVSDTDRRLPVPRAASADDEHGRGLAMVAPLSERWGTDVRRWGKLVWAEITAAVPAPSSVRDPAAPTGAEAGDPGRPVHPFRTDPMGGLDIPAFDGPALTDEEIEETLRGMACDADDL